MPLLYPGVSKTTVVTKSRERESLATLPLYSDVFETTPLGLRSVHRYYQEIPAEMRVLRVLLRRVGRRFEHLVEHLVTVVVSI